jgi:hypothetical protein
MRNMAKRTTKGFAALLKDAHSAADAERKKIEAFKNLARQRPVETAAVVSRAIPL